MTTHVGSRRYINKILRIRSDSTREDTLFFFASQHSPPRSEKVDTSDDQVEELLDAMKAELEKEHATAQTEMEDYFAGLKSRNALIAEEVRDVKEENNALQKEVVALQRRLSLLEVALGE